MDEDGFYHGQLMSGETGLVPSNFIERVMDDSGESKTAKLAILSQLVLQL